MNIALFGGTFDPIHRGHVIVARAAAAKFELKQVWFIPADIPPHKQKTPILSFYHRYAMVALALAGEKGFVPSLLEAPDPATDGSRRKPSYSIDTVRRVKATLGKSDHLYFLIGMDAFKDIAKWHEAEALLGECDFIVAARPGYSLADVASSLPQKLRPGGGRDKVVPQAEDGGAAGVAGRYSAHAARDPRECFGHADPRGGGTRRRTEAAGSRRGSGIHPEGAVVSESQQEEGK